MNKIEKYVIGFLVCLVFINSKIKAQSFSLNDSTIIFKNAEGKILNKDEKNLILKSTFSINKSVDMGGHTVIILYPQTTDNLLKSIKEKEDFRKSWIGKPMVGFSFQDMQGNHYWNSKLLGKVIVFNFWFIKCDPCKREIPFLNSLVNKFVDSSVVFIAPCIDKQPDLLKFLQSNKFEYHIIPDTKALSEQLKIFLYPVDIIVDRRGIISDVILGNNDNKTEGELLNSIYSCLRK